MSATEQAAQAQYEMAMNGAEKEDKLAAEAQVNRAKGAVAEVSSYVNETFLISPIDGEISERYPHVGELVGTGSPVMDVLDLSDTWVVLMSGRFTERFTGGGYFQSLRSGSG